MAAETLTLDALDEKVASTFPGLVVRKDLVRRLRSAYSVPMFVIEFLLGKYCASTDPAVIDQGMDFVQRSLTDKYVKPDQREVESGGCSQNDLDYDHQAACKNQQPTGPIPTHGSPFSGQQVRLTIP